MSRPTSDNGQSDGYDADEERRIQLDDDERDLLLRIRRRRWMGGLFLRALRSRLTPALLIVFVVSGIILVDRAREPDWQPHEPWMPREDQSRLDSGRAVAAWPRFRAAELPEAKASVDAAVADDVAALATHIRSEAVPDLDVALAELAEVRVTLLRSYALVRGKNAGDLLLRALEDLPVERERATAARMLGAIVYEPATLPIFDALVDATDLGTDVRPYIWGLWDLLERGRGEIPNAEEIARGLLRISSEHEATPVRRLAAKPLFDIVRRTAGEWSWVVTRLIEQGHLVDGLACLAVAGRGDAAVRAVDVAEYLESDDDEVRVAALRALSVGRAHSARVDILDDVRSIATNEANELRVRDEAAMAFGSMADPSSMVQFVRRSGDRLGAMAVRTYGDVRAIRDLIEELPLPDFAATVEAAVLRLREHRAELAELAGSPRETVRDLATRVLALPQPKPPTQSSPAAGRARLASLEMLRDRSLEVLEASRLARSRQSTEQLEAVRSIARLGAYELLRELRDLEKSPHSSVRRASQRVADAMLGSRSAGFSVESAARDPSSPASALFTELLGGWQEGISQSR